MNKFFAMAAVFFPLVALALTPMQEQQMNNVSGQAGVSSVLDIYTALQLDTDAWGDPEDGQAGTAGGWVGAKDLGAASAMDGRGVDNEMDDRLYRMLTIEDGRQGGVLSRTPVAGATLVPEALVDQIRIRSRAWGGEDDAGSVYAQHARVDPGHGTGAGLNMDSMDLLARLGIAGMVSLNQIDFYIGQITTSVNALYLTGRDVFGSLSSAIPGGFGNLSDTGFVFTLEEVKDGPVVSYDTIGDVWTNGAVPDDIRPGVLKATSTIGRGTPQTRQPVLGEIFMGGTSTVVEGKISVTETRP